MLFFSMIFAYKKHPCIQKHHTSLNYNNKSCEYMFFHIMRFSSEMKSTWLAQL